MKLLWFFTPTLRAFTRPDPSLVATVEGGAPTDFAEALPADDRAPYVLKIALDTADQIALNFAAQSSRTTSSEYARRAIMERIRATSGEARR